MRQEQSNTTPRQPPKVPRNPPTPQPAGETQSSGAAGETQSSGADSQSRQQDEPQSSVADNENRLENEGETNNNQDSEGVDEVSRPVDKNYVIKILFILLFLYQNRECSGSVVECLTRDRGAAGSNLTGITVLYP